MPMITVSSREFNQDTGAAKKAALKGPVIITDRGKPAHVLLSFEDYKKLAAQERKIGELLAMADAEDADFQAPRSSDMGRAADFI